MKCEKLFSIDEFVVSMRFLSSLKVIPALDRFKSEVTYELVPYGFADHRFVNGGLAYVLL